MDGMYINDVCLLVVDVWDECAGDMSASTPFLLLGPPGIGKTSACREAARMMTEIRKSQDPAADEAVCVVLDTSSMLPEDLAGLPQVRDGVTRYAPQSWMAAVCKPGAYGILCLDDIPVSSPAVQVACRQLMLERRIHDAKLADGIVIMATGNRREDKSAASVLPAHFRNSVVMINVAPDIGNDPKRPGQGWSAWYLKQKDCDPIVMSYLMFRPENFSKLPKDASPPDTAFATPRTWHKLGRLLVSAKRRHSVLSVASGLVGENVAAEFKAFMDYRSQLVSPYEVYEDPAKALPDPKGALDKPDKMYSMVTGLAEVAGQRLKELPENPKAAAPLRVEVYTKWAVALAHVVYGGSQEYCIAGINALVNLGGKVPDMTSAGKALVKTNQKVHAMLEHMQKALLPSKS